MTLTSLFLDDREHFLRVPTAVPPGAPVAPVATRSEGPAASRSGASSLDAGPGTDPGGRGD